MSLLWRSTHCRERRKVEEYSFLEVTDSDNNSIKESVEFSEPSFRMNFLESLGSRLGIRVAEFPLSVGSHFETECRNLTSECRRLIVVVFCVF